jgi:hypothetical protein
MINHVIMCDFETREFTKCLFRPALCEAYDFLYVESLPLA